MILASVSDMEVGLAWGLLELQVSPAALLPGVVGATSDITGDRPLTPEVLHSPCLQARL